jgi:hypothetical protein
MEFGLAGDDSRAAAERLDALFGISMILSSRSSYIWRRESPGEFTVEYNETEDEDGKYLVRDDHPEFPILLTVRNVADQDACEKAILGDPELRATRLDRFVWKRTPQGDVLRETYGPNGEVTVEVLPSRRKKPTEPSGH